MKIQAALFDLDGVIVDTAKYHYLAWRDLAAGLGFEFTPHDNEKLKGVSRMASLELLLAIGNIRCSDEQKIAWADQKNEQYLRYVMNMDASEILPGTREFLTELRNNGIRIALGSASKNAPLILERIGLTTHFDAIVDGNMVHNAKPDPEVFLLGAQLLGVAPANCVVFEDAQAGIEAARNAGMAVIGIGSEEHLTGANFLIPGLHAITCDDLKKFD